MLESCLSHKIIRDFLKNHSENKWKDIIPILIEIGILNLQKAFNKIIFTYEELKKISINLQHEQIEKDKEKSKEINKEINKENIYDSLNIDNDDKKINLKNQNNKIDNNNLKEQKINLIDSTKNNQEKQEKLKISNDTIKEMKNIIKNNYQFFKNNINIDLKNKLTKEKKEHFKKLVIEQNNKKDQKKKDKISYAISYDKNLRPSSIAKKINNNTTTNNTNLKTDFTTNPNNIYFNHSHNFSSEKKLKQSRSKNKTKEKYLNLNLNNINTNKKDKNKNEERKKDNIGKHIVNNNIIRIGGNEKPNYYKKLNNIIKKCNLINNEWNSTNNNYHAIRFEKNKNQVNYNKKVNNSNNYSQINNYFKNSNLMSTLFQKVNSNEKDLKNLNNYFSNREELETFINKNRVDNSKLKDKNEKKLSNYKKNLIKSERQIEKKSSFIKLSEIQNDKNIFDKKMLDKSKNKSTKSLKKKEKEIVNPLLKSLQNKNNILSIDKIEGNTPKKIYVKTEKETISSMKNNNLKEIVEKKEIKKENKDDIKTVKLFDKKEEENKENNPFLKNLSKNRYCNMFGHDVEADFSLTQIEKDCSGIYDSSISNENQINPEFFFKESPKNIFKNEKSNEHSMNSYDHRV